MKHNSRGKTKILKERKGWNKTGISSKIRHISRKYLIDDIVSSRHLSYWFQKERHEHFPRSSSHQFYTYGDLVFNQKSISQLIEHTQYESSPTLILLIDSVLKSDISHHKWLHLSLCLTGKIFYVHWEQITNKVHSSLIGRHKKYSKLF